MFFFLTQSLMRLLGVAYTAAIACTAGFVVTLNMSLHRLFDLTLIILVTLIVIDLRRTQ